MKANNAEGASGDTKSDGMYYQSVHNLCVSIIKIVNETGGTDPLADLDAKDDENVDESIDSLD